MHFYCYLSFEDFEQFDQYIGFAPFRSQNKGASTHESSSLAYDFSS